MVTARLEAQKCAPDQQVPWWPRSIFTASGVTAAERAAMDPAMGAAEALVRKTAYGSPRGFAVRPTWSYGGGVADRTRLHGYEFHTVTFAQCSKYDEHGSSLSIMFNPDPMLWSESDRPMPDERGDGLYTERVRSEPLFGATATFGHFNEPNTEGLFVLFTSRGESPTIPVTREEYLRAQIFIFEGKDQVKLQEAIAATMQLYASDPAGRDKTLAALRAPGERMRARIAAMSAAERASPAWTDGLDLVPSGTPNANAIVRRNPAFYAPRSSPMEVRAILVRMPGTYKQETPQQEQAYREFDWEGLKKLLAR